MTAVWRDAALDGWHSFIRDATRRGARGLEVLDGPDGDLAPLWPLAHVLWAAAEVVAIGGAVDVDAFTPSLRNLRSGDAYAATPGGRRFYDDNAWLGLASLRLLEVTGDDAHRRRAARTEAFVRRGETRAGGVRWAERSPSRNACSTATAAWLVLENARATGDDDGFASRSMTWVHRTLRRRDGLIADRIVRGKVVRTPWSYNQGAAIAAWRRLDRDDRAGSIEAAANERFVGDRLWAEPPAFSTVLERVLLERPSASTLATLDRFLERLLADGRDPVTGWYTSGGLGSYDGRPTIDQAAIVQLFALRAHAVPGG